MPITQKSKIQIRSGLQQNLPVLAKGELGWATDTLRLFIGNGDIEEGAPYVGNTEIITTNNAVTAKNTPVTGTLTGTIDGTNKIFTVPYTDIIADSLIIWRNFPLIPNVGYSVTGQTITFVDAPQVGDILFFQGWVLS